MSPALLSAAVGLASLAGTLLVALVADRLLARRSADRGACWVRVLVLTTWPLVLALLGSWLLQPLAPEAWHQGWHALADLLTPGERLPHLLALLGPLALWLLVLIVVAFIPVRTPGAGRWLAGTLGSSDSRAWLFWVAGLPLGLLMAFATPGVLAPTVATDYPAALWSTTLAAVVTLLFIALGRADTRPRAASAPAPAPARPLPDWPDTLAAAGIGCEPLCQYPGRDPDPTPPPADLPARLAGRGVPAAVFAAVTGEDHRLLLTPAHCGQLEALAWHAGQQALAGNAVALVICPTEAAALRTALLPFLPDGDAAALLDTDTAPDSPAWLWLADARTLSDRLLPLFVANPALFARIGSVVWWDLHCYSGVLAANFWAITHRFDRLLTERRQPVRQLAWVRGAPQPETQLTPFLNLCLPRRFPASAQTAIDAAPVRPLALYLLEAAGAGGDPALAAARASLAAGWRTHLAAPAHLDAQALAHALDSQPGTGLEPDSASAAAYILEIDAEDVLALPDLIAQTGRALAAPSQAPARVQVGLLPAFGNPYVTSLLRRLREAPDLLARRTRRMVAAEPQPTIIARHLLLALHELPATRGALASTFREQQTGVVDATLRMLAERNQVQRREVRLLVEDQGLARLTVDQEYRSVLARDRAPPLTSVGSRLVDVYDPGASVVLRIDPERLTIDAYPFRVFTSDGQRWRVRQWESVPEIIGEGGSMRVLCQREDFPLRTWRVYSPSLTETRSLDGRTDVQILGRNLTRSLVTTTYAERLSGCLEYVQGADGRWQSREHLRLPAMLRGMPMPTSGLLLHIPSAVAAGHPLGLHSVAVALTHVFPVHVGVAVDAVAILAFKDQPLDDGTGWGLMIVDLYPGGIGLVPSLDEDPALLVRLLEDARDWLARCPCQSETGCEHCLQSPIAFSKMADPITMAVSRADALAVMERILRL